MVLSFPLLTNYLWPAVFVFVVAVIVECSFLDTTMAAANNAKVHPAGLPAVLLPRHSRVGRLGHSGLVTNHTKEDGTLHLGCCSRVRRAAHFDGKTVCDHLLPLFSVTGSGSGVGSQGGGAQCLSWPGSPTLDLYLQLLE